MKPGRITFWTTLALVLLLSRLAHLNILWADEDYHLAVGVQLLHGKTLYRDIWYDKPPLSALLTLLIGANPGWPLRLASTLIELAGAAIAFRFASQLWNQRTGYIAAATYAFFHIFFFAHTAIPLEPDSLMIAPHLLAVYWSWRGRPFLAGLTAGLCFLISTKGAFVALACLIVNPAAFLPLSAGFAAPTAIASGWLISQGAFQAYLDQVWRWSFLYANNPLPEPVTGPLGRLGSWIAFHSALWIGAAVAWTRIEDRTLRRKLFLWLGVSFLAAMIGWRFPPRYLSQLFPALVVLGSLGLTHLFKQRSVLTLAAVISIVVPVVRFGPRYGQLIAEDIRGIPHDWRDASLDRESRAAADIINKRSNPGDTIYIWGYRPNVVAYTRLPIAGQLWDSQPVTMVPADRHFAMKDVLDEAWSIEHQQQLIRSKPTFIVDGLTAYNPRLDIHSYPLLKDWLANYCIAAKADPGTVIYIRCER